MASSARSLFGTAARPQPRAATMLVAGHAAPAVLREIDGTGALIAVAMRPPLGCFVALAHPEGGAIDAEVIGHERGGLKLRFERDERATGFALAVIAASFAARG